MLGFFVFGGMLVMKTHELVPCLPAGRDSGPHHKTPNSYVGGFGFRKEGDRKNI
jgi:hypothetical protein